MANWPGPAQIDLGENKRGFPKGKTFYSLLISPCQTEAEVGGGKVTGRSAQRAAWDVVRVLFARGAVRVLQRLGNKGSKIVSES